MLALGLLSILQVAFLPGYLVVRLLGLSGGLARTLILSFPISLLCNHLFVSGTVAMGVYGRGLLFSTIAAELIALLVLWLRTKPPEANAESDWDRWKQLVESVKGSPLIPRIAGTVWLVAGCLVLLCYLYWSSTVLGSVFSQWDTVVSYNRWALDWFAGILPRQTWHYPQLWPTAIAETYTIIGTSDIQFFATAMIPLFPLAMMLALFDVALRLRDPRYIGGAAAAGLAVRAVLPYTFMGGMTDEPVAALSFIAVYALLLARNAASAREAAALLLAGSLVTAAAALTKQAGWYVAGLYPILAYLLVLRQKRDGRPMARWGVLVGCLILLPALLVLPWNIYLKLHPSGSEFAYVMDKIHAGRTYFQRAERAVGLLSRLFHLPGWAVCSGLVVLLGASLLDRAWRWITLLIAIPGLVFWMIFLSYDPRNVVTAVPPGAVACIMGLTYPFRRARAVQNLRTPAVHPRLARFGAAAVFAGTATAVLTIVGRVSLPVSEMRASQDRLQRQIFAPSINQQLYDYHFKQGFQGPILTNYQILQALPGLAPLYRADYLAKDLDLDSRNKDVRYVMFFGGEEVPKAVTNEVARGRLKEILKGPTHHVYIVEPAP